MNGSTRIGTLIAAAILCASAVAQVSNSSGFASICIEPCLSILKVTDPDWGKVIPPSAGTATYLLDYLTGRVTCSSGDGFAANDGQRGEFLVSGAPGTPITYAVTMTSLGDPDISIRSAIVNGNIDHGTDLIGADGRYSVKVGGSMSISAASAYGPHSVVVTLEVHYN